MMLNILVINPGSTSTKISWFQDSREAWTETVRHDPSEIAKFTHTFDQYQFRLETIEKEVNSRGYNFDSLSCVVGRGGIIDPIPGGTYRVDRPLLERLKSGKPWDHASNLGGVLAYAIAHPLDIDAFIVDPVSVDELDEVARVTGLPEMTKISLNHTLNVKAMVRRACGDLDLDWDNSNFIVAHLGGGITVCAHKGGKLVDFNSGNEFGPFSPERAGGLPAGDLAKLCFRSKMTPKEMKKKLAGNGGVVAYLGTSDIRQVKKMAQDGDDLASLVLKSMAYQISCAIGSMASALSGSVDAVIFTGGISYDSEFIASIQSQIQWIAPSLIYPGEEEMKALAEGAKRVLSGEEEPKIYSDVLGG